MKNTRILNHANSWPVEEETTEYSTDQWKKLSSTTIPTMTKRPSKAKPTTKELTRTSQVLHHISRTRCKYSRRLFKILKRIARTKGCSRTSTRWSWTGTTSTERRLESKTVISLEQRVITSRIQEQSMIQSSINFSSMIIQSSTPIWNKWKLITYCWCLVWCQTISIWDSTQTRINSLIIKTTELPMITVKILQWSIIL